MVQPHEQTMLGYARRRQKAWQVGKSAAHVNAGALMQPPLLACGTALLSRRSHVLVDVLEGSLVEGRILQAYLGAEV